MRFILVRNGDFSKLAERQLSQKEILQYHRLMDFSGRIQIYGMPVVMIIWCLLSWPNVFPEKGSVSIIHFVFIAAGLIIFTPFIHELLHLLSFPNKILLTDTYFITSLNGIRSHFAVRLGGKISYLQVVWSALFPFIVLTLLPFFWLIVGLPIPLSISVWVGFIASYNFGCSTADIIIAFGLLYKNNKNKSKN